VANEYPNASRVACEAMITAISTAVVSQRSPVVSSAMKVMVNGPPITAAESALMPITA
jgi:hypothetical protein